MNIELSNITLFWLPNGNASGVATASLSDTASVLIIACDHHLFLFHIVVHDLLAFQTSSLAGQHSRVRVWPARLHVPDIAFLLIWQSNLKFHSWHY